MVVGEQYLIGILIHVVGLLIFGGGQLWILRNCKSVDYGNSSILFKAVNYGLLTLFFGGTISLVYLNEPGFLGLPKTFGWIVLIKLLLYVTIALNNILVTEQFFQKSADTALENVSLKSEKPLIASKKLGLIVKINLFLTFVGGLSGLTLNFL